MKNLKIQISGTAGSGKTNVALEICDILQSHGFNVNLSESITFELEDMHPLDSIQLINPDKRKENLALISKHSEISIDTVQVSPESDTPTIDEIKAYYAK